LIKININIKPDNLLPELKAGAELILHDFSFNNKHFLTFKFITDTRIYNNLITKILIELVIYIFEKFTNKKIAHIAFKDFNFINIEGNYITIDLDEWDVFNQKINKSFTIKG